MFGHIDVNRKLTGQPLTFDMITVTTSSKEDVGFWNLFEQQRTYSSVKNFTSVVEAVTKLESAFEQRYCHYLAGIFETTLWKEYSSLLYFRTLEVWKKDQMQMNQGKLSQGIICWVKLMNFYFGVLTSGQLHTFAAVFFDILKTSAYQICSVYCAFASIQCKPFIFQFLNNVVGITNVDKLAKQCMSTLNQLCQLVHVGMGLIEKKTKSLQVILFF